MGSTKASGAGPTHRIAMAALALAMLLASLSTSIANIALPALAKAFAAPFSHVQWVVVAYLATLTLMAAPAGRLGDAHGLKRMQLFGLGLFALAALACGLASTLWQLVAARALQGLGAAFLMTLTMALMRETARDAQMGRAMGLLGTMSALGTALGPALGGMLLAAWGWKSVFLVQVPLAVLALIFSVLALPQQASSVKQASPAPRGVFEPAMRSHLLSNLLVAAVMMSTLVVGPFYLGLGMGLTPARVGAVMSVGPLISIASGLPAGRAVDAWGARRVLRVGLLMLVAGTAMMAVVPDAFGLAGYLAAIAVLTPGYQLFQAANSTLVLARIPKSRQGLVSGGLGLSRNLGLIIGASAMGAVFAWAVGGTDLGQASSPAIAGGMRLTFMLASGMMGLALWIASGPGHANAVSRREQA
ncbi:MAG: MFS transporter [Burkholderiaceae bacterium]|nr:MFS transporter [Roseateles sp.]MBV8471154.1 MFS transporter [Burkholderiaceae bacterium]